MSEIIITKSNGDQEVFDDSKLIRSLQRVQATELEIDRVLHHVRTRLRNGMTTRDIYSLAHNALASFQKKNPKAIRYSLKQSIMQLGPSGFPFEQFVARVYVELGYTCQVGVMVQGNCIQHEVDILAYKGDEVICIEAKFHNEPYMKSDTKVALYVKARFDDLVGQKISIDKKNKHITRGILITNTNFTDNAEKYVECTGGYDLISWNKPEKKGLLDYIQDYGLHPVTVIPELKKREITALLNQGVIVCSDIKKQKHVLTKIGIKHKRQHAIMETIDMLCNFK